MKTRKFQLIHISLAVILFLAACATSNTPTARPPAATATQEVATIVPTPSLAPSPTAAPGKLLLVIPPGSPQPAAQEIQSAVMALAKSASLVVEPRTELKPADIAPEVRVVIWVNAAAEALQLASAAPRTAFALFTTAELKPTANTTVIRLRSEHQAFIAGLVAATLTPDWRAGALLPSGNPAAQSFQDAFMTGARYFCGRCMPGWPLGMVFPQVAALPPTSDAKAWQNAATDLIQNKKVEVIFLSPESATPDVLKYFDGKKLILFGLQTPAEEYRALWALTVRMDAVSPLQKAFPDLLAGKGGAVLNAAITLENVQVERLGEGRQKYIKDILQELQAGLIHPFSVSGQ
jgi:hypothetical protein